MCLSSIYNKSVDDNNLLIRNVQQIKVDGDNLIFTDILEDETRMVGKIVSADLVEGRVIVDIAQ